MPSTLPALLLLSFFLSHPPATTTARPAPQKGNEQVTIQPSNPRSPWHNFTYLHGAEPGSRLPGTSELKRYLTRFGYLPANTTNFTDSFDTSLSSAVAHYQSNHGLHTSSRLDQPTLNQMTSPRCGVTDSPSTVVSHFAFFSSRPRWARQKPMTLTYALSPTASIDYIAHDNIRAVLRRAFGRWSGVIPVSFKEIDDYETADVKVAFYAGDHGDGEPFDGVLGVLAHAFSPESGQLHLDSAERWSVDFEDEGSPEAVDLESVMTHEIGHVLGLAHSEVKESIMYPSLSPRTRKVDLRVDDVEGVQALYGSNPNFRFSSLLDDTSSVHSIGSINFGWIIWRACIGLILFCL